MNGERMRRLADALEGAEDFDMEGLAARGDRLDRRNGRLGNMNRFHMGEWASGWRTAAGEEGTVGGVAGWACALFGDERELGEFKRPDGLYEVPEFMCAQELLDLSADEAEELFSPNQAIWTPSRIKAKDAAAAVRKAATGLNQFSWWKHLDDERETTMREYEVSVFRVDGSSRQGDGREQGGRGEDRQGQGRRAAGEPREVGRVRSGGGARKGRGGNGRMNIERMRTLADRLDGVRPTFRAKGTPRRIL